MSENEATKGKGSGWTDRERLAYLVSVIENSETKLNFKTSPLPAGRSQIACERMFGRLKTTLKAELEALKSGAPMPNTTAATTATATTANANANATAGDGTPKKATPRKRKGEGEEGSPVKKGRAKKGAAKGVEEKKVEEQVDSEVKEEEEEEV